MTSDRRTQLPEFDRKQTIRKKNVREKSYTWDEPFEAGNKFRTFGCQSHCVRAALFGRSTAPCTPQIVRVTWSLSFIFNSVPHRNGVAPRYIYIVRTVSTFMFAAMF